MTNTTQGQWRYDMRVQGRANSVVAIASYRLPDQQDRGATLVAFLTDDTLSLQLIDTATTDGWKNWTLEEREALRDQAMASLSTGWTPTKPEGEAT